MFKNYFKTALRNLWKHKTYTSINVFGLSLAFICSILLFINVSFELSFDDFYTDRDKIFKVYKQANNPSRKREQSSSMAFPVATTLKEEIPQVQATTRFLWGGQGAEYKNKKLDIQVNLVDKGFFDVFSFPIIQGNKNNPLSDLGNVVVSEASAEKIFNKEDPIGKLIKVKVYGEWKEFLVSAVVKNFPNNSSITYGILIRSELHPDYNEQKNNWNASSHDVYIKLTNNGTKEFVEKECRNILRKYDATDSTYAKNAGYLKDENGDYQSLHLLPLSEFHFNKNVGVGNKVISKTYLYSILLISIFILLIASFNFINLNVARSFTRAKEVGIRKCLGATKRQILLQIWGESFIVCVMALLIGILGSTLLFPLFNKLFGANLTLSFFYKPSSILFMIISTIVVSVLAGGYPAHIISKLNTVSILKGGVSLKKSGIFRNTLIVLQFGIACFLMACTLIAYNQFEFMRTMPLGFTKEAVISVPLSNSQQGRATLTKFRNMLSTNPSVLSITGSDINIGMGKDGSISKTTSGFGYNEKSISTNLMTVDYDFLKTLGIKLKIGRDFSREFGTDSISSVIVTESVAKQFEVKEALGLSFSMDSTQPNINIIGIIPDFHLYSLHEEAAPLSMFLSNYSSISYVFIKTTSSNSKQIMEQVEKVYKQCEPGKEFKGSFLDENTNNWYKKEEQLSLLLFISSIIAIILSCLGLFALALLMIQQRTKEIGVRKVLGASITSINLLLMKEFVKLILVSIIVASPLAWWIMNKWLQDFPYKIEITIGLFILIGLVAIIISVLTIGYQAIKAASTNPVKSLRTD